MPVTTPPGHYLCDPLLQLRHPACVPLHLRLHLALPRLCGAQHLAQPPLELRVVGRQLRSGHGHRRVSAATATPAHTWACKVELTASVSRP